MARAHHAKRTLRMQQLERSLSAAPPERLAALKLTPDQLRSLQMELQGRIVFPWDPDYEKDRRGNCMYPNLAEPALIVYCEVASDVGWCLQYVRSADMPFAPRSGGHSSAGYCVTDGMVIDVSLMNGVAIMPDYQSVLVQAGAPLSTLYAALDPYDLHVPGGECDTVGVAGHMQGGGYGFTSRTFGLNCDVVERVWMMLADGRTVRADATQNQDLFWAVRGGTGNNFGILLQIQYAVASVGDLWGFVLRWPIDDAPDVLVELQANFVRSGVTDDLGYQLCFGAVDGVQYFYMMGMFDGTEAGGSDLLAPLLEIGSPTMTFSRMGRYKDLNGELLSWFQMPPADTMEIKDSNYIADALSAEGWRSIVDYFKTSPNPYNLAAMEVYGGKATAGPAGGCAFIHRQVDFDLFTDSFCNDHWSYDREPEALEWLAGFNALVEQVSNGHKYQNYPNVDSADYRWNYWGDAFNSLLFVKQKYDPNDVFTFPQGISPYPDDPSITRSDVPSMFDDPTIVYEPGRSR